MPRVLRDEAPTAARPAEGRRRCEPTDEILLERIANGDRGALAVVYDHFCAAVYGMTLRVIRDPSIAEDVTHDVFLAMWAKAPGFDATRGSARSWILTIAHRRAVDEVRREQASRDRLTRVETNVVHRPFDEVAEVVLRRCDDREVKVALQALTPIQRQAVELAYYQGLTYRQVAQHLDVPLGTIKTRIRDGLRRLRANLAQAAPATAGAPSSTSGDARSA